MSIEAVSNNNYSASIYEKKREELEKAMSSEDVNKINAIPDSEKEAEEAVEAAKTPRYDKYVKGDAQEPIATEEGAPDEKPSASKGASEGDDVKTTKTTVNTDKIEAEIKKLKQEKQNIQSELQRAADDKDKSSELEKRLEIINSEITLKSSDSYKKQHAVIS